MGLRPPSRALHLQHAHSVVSDSWFSRQRCRRSTLRASYRYVFLFLSLSYAPVASSLMPRPLQSNQWNVPSFFAAGFLCGSSTARPPPRLLVSTALRTIMSPGSSKTVWMRTWGGARCIDFTLRSPIVLLRRKRHRRSRPLARVMRSPCPDRPLFGVRGAQPIDGLASVRTISRHRLLQTDSRQFNAQASHKARLVLALIGAPRTGEVVIADLE